MASARVRKSEINPDLEIVYYIKDDDNLYYAFYRDQFKRKISDEYGPFNTRSEAIDCLELEIAELEY